jgi:hypothetical protein
VRNAKSEFAFLFLIIAGIASVAMSAFGLLAAAWGGLWAGSAISDRILHLLFWLLPALSIVAFVGYFTSKRAGLIGSWAIAVGSMIGIFVVNLNSCLAGECTTKHPIKIALGVFLLPHIWILLASSLSLQLAKSTGGGSAVLSEQEPSTAVS